MRFNLQTGFLNQPAVIAIAGADEDSGIRSRQRRRQDAGIFQACPRKLQQHPLLRIGDLRFHRGHAEKARIKTLNIVYEAALIDSGILRPGGPASPRRWKRTDHAFVRGQHLPEVIRSLYAAGKLARHANDRDIRRSDVFRIRTIVTCGQRNFTRPAGRQMIDDLSNRAVFEEEA